MKKSGLICFLGSKNKNLPASSVFKKKVARETLVYLFKAKLYFFSEMGDIGFEEQLEQERLAREHEEARLLDTHPKTRTDPDGTVFEWDVEKKAWFPKVDTIYL